jgi:hypothetical protein
MIGNAIVAVVVMAAIGFVLVWVRGAFRKGSCGGGCADCGETCEARKDPAAPADSGG